MGQLADAFLFYCVGNRRLYNEDVHTFCSAVLLGDENATIHIDAVIDPLSPTGQKLASLLQVLQKHVQTSMRIVLNPMVSKTNTVI